MWWCTLDRHILLSAPDDPLREDCITGGQSCEDTHQVCPADNFASSMPSMIAFCREGGGGARAGLAVRERSMAAAASPSPRDCRGASDPSPAVRFHKHRKR
jgi:hypothetical protein